MSGARWTEAELAKLQNAKRGAKKEKGWTTNALTRAILTFLETQGVDAGRTNTVGIFDQKTAVKKLLESLKLWIAQKRFPTESEITAILRKCYRKSHEQKGKPDISGHHRKLGVAVYVEVKTGQDSLSIYQLFFLREARKAGCIAIEARDFDSFVEEYERQFLAVLERNTKKSLGGQGGRFG